MVCKLKAKNRQKCFQYFPTKDPVKLEDFKITLAKCSLISKNLIER